MTTTDTPTPGITDLLARVVRARQRQRTAEAEAERARKAAYDATQSYGELLEILARVAIERGRNLDNGELALFRFGGSVYALSQGSIGELRFESLADKFVEDA